MFTYWTDFDRNLAHLEQVRRMMGRLFEDYEAGPPAFEGWGFETWPRTNVFDTGNAVVLRAEVPGLTDKDIKLSFHEDVLTLSGERKSDAPQGYQVHRQERGPMKFSRSFSFPMRIDAESANAEVKNGILTVTLPKHPQSQPREISVKTS